MHAIRASSIGQTLCRTRRLQALPVVPAWRATSPRLPFPPHLGLTHKRQFQAEALYLPPLVFAGLLVALWTQKCIAMVVFQNKIIYMPGLPPNARRERIQDYTKQCWGVLWEEKRVQAADGTDLALCVASATSTGDNEPTSHGDTLSVPSIYILYFQGNASSIPPRLPDLSWVLRELQQSKRPARYTMVCLSYRGYWTSRGRPSEKGINLDAQAALHWIGRMHREHDAHGHQPQPEVILWGQSIGAGVATNLAAWEAFPPTVRLRSLILETPFTSVKDMLVTLYPQKWVPYRHLWPFLRNHLDSWTNLAAIARNRSGKRGKPRITIVEAGRDELVPAEHGAKLVQRCEEVGLTVEKKTVRNAFHNDAIFKLDGRRAVVDAIEQVAAEI
ncbi:Alpha/Beta hydrolase protein [Colletotrichum navitas]|uniref:Alpha/Beta hydrolase protein n=1 Tax=Colletotrichum navitas TaxID=681940 RepID=A0AAD8Q4U4_9PEZI|nr:Alpha/Beta hydrolase protein [Colletotrichum navitas]KAK1595891.1 Alpha/Beta hydrolase protein [Colletotrichum navitas]